MEEGRTNLWQVVSKCKILEDTRESLPQFRIKVNLILGNATALDQLKDSKPKYELVRLITTAPPTSFRRTQDFERQASHVYYR